MDYNLLLDLVEKLGYRLAMSGAETFRIEESVNRIFASYGIESQAFAIPNLLIISIVAEDGKSMTRMRRIGQHGNDLDSVERYSNLSRRICAEHPDPEDAIKWLSETDNSRVHHRLPIAILGHFLGAFGFSVFFGGNLSDAICAGVCGILIGLISVFAEKWKVNSIFTTAVSAFVMAFAAFSSGCLGLSANPTASVVGALMILVPGLLFTNAMRDIIYGDTNSGINRIVQVLLIAVAIALGTGAAWSLVGAIFPNPVMPDLISGGYALELLGALIGCLGFTIYFNIHFPGGIFCVIGGVLTWGAYCVAHYLGASPVLSNFIAAVVASVYAECMARIRKYPAISYLVVSCFPLLPGAGIFYTTYYALMGDAARFASQGKQTIAIAGVLAIGIIISSTVFRFISLWKQRKNA